MRKSAPGATFRFGSFAPFTASFTNRKGGVGKSSCVAHLGGVIAQAGKKVLIIDNDPQGSISQLFLGAAQALTLPRENTLSALFDETLDPDPGKIVRPTAFENLFIAPCTGDLNRYDHPGPFANGQLQYALRQFVQEVQACYDVVLIDNRPTLNFLAWCALLAADGVVLPVQPEDFGSQGLVHVLQQVRRAQAGFNPRLRVFGYLLTMVRPRLGVHSAYEQELRSGYGDQVFTSYFPDLKDYKEAVTLRAPISYSKPRSRAAATAHAVALELVRRSRSSEWPSARAASLREQVGV